MVAEVRPSDAPVPEVLSVALGRNEEVRWIWTHTAVGESVVTGYTIVKKDDKERLEV